VILDRRCSTYALLVRLAALIRCDPLFLAARPAPHLFSSSSRSISFSICLCPFLSVPPPFHHDLALLQSSSSLSSMLALPLLIPGKAAACSRSEKPDGIFIENLRPAAQ